ncbi:hypothetical protein GCM10023183_37500 [Nibribacter koreensis]|uniref:Uncharacterized protein n=1 Tax=Nibribacter koreensis TaxID=1084519 RepID=A0ABP8G316_9BACT
MIDHFKAGLLTESLKKGTTTIEAWNYSNFMFFKFRKYYKILIVKIICRIFHYQPHFKMIF